MGKEEVLINSASARHLQFADDQRQVQQRRRLQVGKEEVLGRKGRAYLQLVDYRKPMQESNVFCMRVSLLVEREQKQMCKNPIVTSTRYDWIVKCLDPK